MLRKREFSCYSVQTRVWFSLKQKRYRTPSSFEMGRKIFLAIFLFFIFLCQQFHVAVLKLSEDDEFDSMRPYQFDHFKPLEYELVIYVDVPATNPYYWGSVKMTVEMIPNNFTLVQFKSFMICERIFYKKFKILLIFLLIFVSNSSAMIQC